MRELLWTFVAMLLVGQSSRSQDAPPPLPSTAVKPFEGVVRDLMRLGRREDAKEMLDLALALGYPKKDQGMLQSIYDKTRREQVRPDVVLRTLDTVMAGARREVDKLDAESKLKACRMLLALDGNCEPLRKALGHERVGPYWLAPEHVPMRARRVELLDAVQRARTLPVAVQASESKDAYLNTVLGRNGSEATWDKVTLRTPWGQALTQRILEQALHGCALANWLDTGVLEPPKRSKNATIYLFDVREQFQKAAATSLEQNGITDVRAKSAKEWDWSFADSRGFEVWMSRGELATTAELFHELAAHEKRHPALEAGRLNWVALQLWDAQSAGYAVRWILEADADDYFDFVAHNTTAEAPLEWRLLSLSGFAGRQAWIAYLARRREDPPFKRGFKSDLEGDKLSKCTSVFQYLYESGLYEKAREVISRTASDGSLADPSAAFELAFGFGLQELEDRWRAWLLPIDTSVRARVAALQPPPPAADAKELLEALNMFRVTALSKAKGMPRIWTVVLDEELSYGAMQHARYLKANAEQLTKWPGVREEDPAKGATPEGMQAAARCLVAIGCNKSKDAIEQWVGNVWARIRLMQPGMLRIGYARIDDLVVVDVGSYTFPHEDMWFAPWPVDGMKDVPTTLRLSQPSPLPENESTQVGSPITLLIGVDRQRAMRDVTMNLFEIRGREKIPVPCHFSSYHQPLTWYAPRMTFTLIPKAPLKGGTDYRVEAEAVGEKKSLSWGFKTGR